MPSGSPHPTALDLRLAPDHDAPRVARQALADWLPTTVASHAQLVISELVTNAVLHAEMDPFEEITVRARLTGDALRLEVEDTGRGFVRPALAMPAPESRMGRGLPIVARLARCWGVGPHPAGGFRVWAKL